MQRLPITSKDRLRLRSAQPRSAVNRVHCLAPGPCGLRELVPGNGVEPLAAFQLQSNSVSQRLAQQEASELETKCKRTDIRGRGVQALSFLFTLCSCVPKKNQQFLFATYRGKRCLPHFQHLLIPLTGKIDKKQTIISDMNMGMEGIVEMETLANGRR